MKPIALRSLRLLLLGAALALIIAACNYPTPELPRAAPSDALTPDRILTAPTASPTPTPKPLRVLAICLWQEPKTLFVYGDSSTAARAVRQAIYDGPFDLVNYSVQPVILQEIPSLANGGASLEAVQVEPGASIVDAEGRLTVLQEGVVYLPSGCRDTTCALSYSGNDPVMMDQLAARFSLRQGLVWSDGTPLTAGDSVFSYEIARALYPQVRSNLIQRTDDYRALDESSLEWRGVPGWFDPQYAANFFHPLPEHALGETPADQLADSDAAGRKPLGWGAYILTEWVAGDHITLERNSRYFRAGEGLPAFDRLVFRFVSDANQALSALAAGECDVVDETGPGVFPSDTLNQFSEAGRVALQIEPDTAWEHLDFGIKRADATPSFFTQKEVRQAVALCLDRQRIVQALFPNQSQVMHTYAPSAHPLFNPQARQYPYDPVAGATLLQSAGWLDPDNDPQTPRVALAAPGAADGALFQVEFLTQDSPEHRLAAEVIRDSLAGCGIEINIRYLETEDLFAPGPEGEVFGRRFDLAQFGWSASLEPACELYTTAQIPGPYPEYPMGWGGANASGYSQAEYDAVCALARNSLPDEARHREAHLQAQAIFAEDFPVLPLYSRFRVVAHLPDLCGLRLDPLADGAFWNLESLNYAEGCNDG